MTEDCCIISHANQKKTNDFLYKSISFPVDFDLIKIHSNFFKSHQSDYNDNESIEIDFPIDISTESIQIFIDFCNFKQVTISNSNVFDLNFLSIQFEVLELKQYTEQYIKNHYKDLIIESIIFKHKLQGLPNQNQEFSIDLINEENILAEHLNEYFSDSKILSISINSLYRIVKRYIELHPNDINGISSFLLFCLKNHPQNASILFSLLNAEQFDKNLILKLHDEFPDKFNFNMLNSKPIFETTYELLSKFEQLKFEMNQSLQEEKDASKSFTDYAQLNDARVQNILDQQKQFEAKIKNKQTSYESEIKAKIDRLEKDTNSKMIELQNVQSSMKAKQNEFEQRLLNEFYPVGTIYQTFNDQFNPNASWGGTWTKVEGRFILGSSQNHKINSLGGEETHSLTIEEIPSHSHNFYIRDVYIRPESQNGPRVDAGNWTSKMTTENTGGGRSHNNMPPYRAAHIWERIQ